MKIKKTKAGFALIEVILVIAIILIIAVPILRLVYHQEIDNFENNLFEKLGVGQTARYIILGILGCIVIYFRIKPDIVEAKRKKIPIVGKPVIYFSILSILSITLLFAFGVLK